MLKLDTPLLYVFLSIYKVVLIRDRVQIRRVRSPYKLAITLAKEARKCIDYQVALTCGI